jgi:hypothetical protein
MYNHVFNAIVRDVARGRFAVISALVGSLSRAPLESSSTSNSKRTSGTVSLASSGVIDRSSLIALGRVRRQTLFEFSKETEKVGQTMR